MHSSGDSHAIVAFWTLCKYTQITPIPIRSRSLFMDFTTLLGLIAGICTTIAFVPQLLKTWRTRSADDISAGMLITFEIGLLLWLVYGLLIGSSPVILANSVTLVLTFIILYFKFRFKS
jgi:MtN3 and saliva related transmembrane protein